MVPSFAVIIVIQANVKNFHHPVFHRFKSVLHKGGRGALLWQCKKDTERAARHLHRRVERI